MMTIQKCTVPGYQPALVGHYRVFRVWGEYMYKERYSKSFPSSKNSRTLTDAENCRYTVDTASTAHTATATTTTERKRLS